VSLPSLFVCLFIVYMMKQKFYSVEAGLVQDISERMWQKGMVPKFMHYSAIAWE
jgi:hypothetical protein